MRPAGAPLSTRSRSRPRPDAAPIDKHVRHVVRSVDRSQRRGGHTAAGVAARVSGTYHQECLNPRQSANIAEHQPHRTALVRRTNALLIGAFSRSTRFEAPARAGVSSFRGSPGAAAGAMVAGVHRWPRRRWNAPGPGTEELARCIARLSRVGRGHGVAGSWAGPRCSEPEGSRSCP
jgi:hypothetical protein